MLIPWILVCIIIVSINIIRFIGLQVSPPGFYIDEAFGASHILCLKETGHDFFGEYFALFSKVYSYGFQTAPYLYSEALWTSLFGTSITALRSFLGFVTVLTIIGIMKLAHALVKEKDLNFVLLVGLSASLMPWSFQFSRISWDAPMGPMFLVWSLYFIYRKPNQLSLDYFSWDAVLGGALLALAGYTYSPMRVQVAIMVLFLPNIPIRKKIMIAGVFGVACIPAALKYLDPIFTARSKLLALTSDYEGNPYRARGFFGLLLAYLSQILMHLSPSFLIGSGDHNLRHSTQSFGQMDWLTAMGCLITSALLTFKKLRSRFVWSNGHVVIAKLSLLGILAGITPAALTWEGVPHAIRSLGSWPFFVMFGAVGLSALIQKIPKLAWVAVGVALVFFSLYIQDYFVNYPIRARDWFDQSIVEHAERGEFANDYGPLARGYFLMSRQGMSCDAIPKN